MWGLPGYSRGVVRRWNPPVGGGGPLEPATDATTDEVIGGEREDKKKA